MKKKMSNLSKLLLAVLFVLAGVVISGKIGVKADTDKDEIGIVRVSNTKQLQKAINNPDISIIIFKTREMDKFTIKANENAMNKTLIIDAPNAFIVNKAVFYEIYLHDVISYTESVSGNYIVFYFNPDRVQKIKVAKKKTVEKFTFVTLSTFDERYNCYTLSKGAKINNVNMVYYGADDVVYAESDEDNNTLSLKYTDNDKNDRSYTVQLDDRGRIKRMISDATFNFDYKFKYNKNGYKIKFTGDDDDDKNCKYVCTMKGDYILKETMVSDNSTYEYEYFFEDGADFRCPYKVTYYHKRGDLEEGWTKTYTYDSKNRVGSCFTEYLTGEKEKAVTYYDSKDFTVKEVYTYYDEAGEQIGDILTVDYEYSKSGDIIKKTFTSGDEVNVIRYEYNEYGECVNIIGQE